MGFAVNGEDGANAESSVADDSEEVGNDDESIVHQTASVGDVEVQHDDSSQFVFPQGPFIIDMKEILQSNNQMQTHL